MPDSYTSALRLVLMPDGSNDTLWGDKASLTFQMIEQAIAGAIGISLTASDHTLTTANNASDEARNATISFTGTPGVTRTVTVPDKNKLTLMINNTNANVIFTAGAGATAALQPGQVGILLADGATNVYMFVIADLPGHAVLPQVFSGESL